MKEDQSALVTERYTVCRPKLYTEGKIIYNTRFDAADDFISMHGMDVKWHSIKIPPVNSYKKFVVWDFHKVNRHRYAAVQINHYWSKSFEAWQRKYEKGSIEKGTKWKNYDFFEKLEQECTTTDYTIYRFLMKLKGRMA